MMSWGKETITKKLIEALNFSVCAVLIVQMAGCGTIMYPERKGQRDGRIDAGVAVLDGIGLLFFIIPGAEFFSEIDLMRAA